jgi:hypothetical protein
MRESHIHRCVVGLLIVASALLGSACEASAEPAACGEAIARALKLLQRQPDKVVVVDAAAVPRRPNEKPRRVEAFVKSGDRLVYLVRQGVTLQQALKRGGIWDYVLAIKIWHEMAHIDGADEVGAQLAEERLWIQFLLARRVDGARGLEYLVLLTDRRKTRDGGS